jgi:hypothetical protein
MARHGAPPPLAPLWCCLLATSLSCLPRPADRSDDEPPAKTEEEPLDLTIDRVDLSHGVLRLKATMNDGSADVSILLGTACEPRELGGGLATASSLVWSLAEDDLAGALGCDILVVARASTSTGTVLKTAPVPVGVEMASSGSDEAAQPPDVQRSTSEMRLVFPSGSARDSDRLSVGDSLVEPSQALSDSQQTTHEFAVSRHDLARAILSRRPLRLGRSSFDVSVSVGGVPLEVDQVPEDEVAAPP